MKAVIYAASFGTRFLPLTKAHPKAMLPVANCLTIQWVVEETERLTLPVAVWEGRTE